MNGTERSDFDVIRDFLLTLDPETRHQVIASMRLIRDLPAPAAVRIMINAAWRDQARGYGQPLVSLASPF